MRDEYDNEDDTMKVEPKTTPLDDLLWNFTLLKYAFMLITLGLFFGAIIIAGIIKAITGG